MSCKNLQIKSIKCMYNEGGKLSSTTIATYFNKDDEEYVFDNMSYFELTPKNLSQAVDHISKFNQLHNYYSLPYNELVNNADKFIIRVKIKLTDIPELCSMMNFSLSESSISSKILFNLQGIIPMLDIDNGKEYVDIAMYYADINDKINYIMSCEKPDDVSPVLPFSRVTEFTNLAELNLGGFGNIVSGINTVTFGFLPFLHNNKIFIQNTGSGTLSNNGLVVSYIGYEADSLKPTSMLTVTFSPLDGKDKLFSNKSEFEIFNSRISEVMNNFKLENLKDSESDYIKFKFESFKYETIDGKPDEKFEESLNKVFSSLMDEPCLIFDNIHRGE